MELTRCTGCMELIPEGEVRYAFDEPYCERCFDDQFTYCCQCDRLLSREDVQWDRDGDPLIVPNASKKKMTMRVRIILKYMMQTGNLLLSSQEGF